MAGAGGLRLKIMWLGNGVEFGQELEENIKMMCKDNEEEEKEESREEREDEEKQGREMWRIPFTV